MRRLKMNSVISHLTGWLIFLLLPVLFLGSGNKQGVAWVVFTSPYYWLFCLTYLVMFYFNLWYLIPQFFLKKRYWQYITGIIVLLGFVYFLQPFDKLLVHNPRFTSQMDALMRQHTADSIKTATLQARDSAFNGPQNKLPFGPLPHEDLRMQVPVTKPDASPTIWQHRNVVDTVSLFLFVMVVALGLSVRTVEQWQQTEQKVVKAEAEKVNAELSFLKAQINPHFLFNTLNNIYTLSVMNSEHTSESIMKLSNIMRYVTDDVTQNFVPLEQDLQCIRNYVDLQKLRLGKKCVVTLNVDGDTANRQVAPLIMMSFVENTFKYGVSKQVECPIYINIRIHDDRLSFTCRNLIFENRSGLNERAGGIGIANTRQRLEHLYPNRHQLDIKEQDGIFTVELLLIG